VGDQFWFPDGWVAFDLGLYTSLQVPHTNHINHTHYTHTAHTTPRVALIHFLARRLQHSDLLLVSQDSDTYRCAHAYGVSHTVSMQMHAHTHGYTWIHFDAHMLKHGNGYGDKHTLVHNVSSTRAVKKARAHVSRRHVAPRQ